MKPKRCPIVGLHFIQPNLPCAVLRRPLAFALALLVMACSQDSEQARAVPPAALSQGKAAVLSRISFDTVQDEEDGWKLIVKSGGETIIGPSASYVSVVAEHDFNGDGTLDALVATSQGGNCCPATYMFVSVINGKLVTAELPEGWADIKIIERGGRHFVKRKTVEATELYSFDGRAAVKLEEIPKLAAIAEIYGPGGMGHEGTVAFEADIDMDGKTEQITCPIWPRWGSLSNCEVKIKGKTHILNPSTGCDRFGVLNASANGFRKIVCNNDIIFSFDGSLWKEDKREK